MTTPWSLSLKTLRGLCKTIEKTYTELCSKCSRRCNARNFQRRTSNDKPCERSNHARVVKRLETAHQNESKYRDEGRDGQSPLFVAYNGRRDIRGISHSSEPQRRYPRLRNAPFSVKKAEKYHTSGRKCSQCDVD